MGLFDALEQMDAPEEDRIVRAPFGYVGSKLKSIKHILPMLPYRKSYIEVFGGSGVVLLNRRPSRLDVYNDRFGGVVAFYRCLKDKELFQQLCDWLETTVHAKEEFYYCLETWQDCSDTVERAGRWFYIMQYSFANKGLQWGRNVSTSGALSGQVRRKAMEFQRVHTRLSNVQIENASWDRILKDYDNEDAVFYLDPPYMSTDVAGYVHKMSVEDHRRLLETIMDMKGFVALSGFANSLYDGYEWDCRKTWNLTCTMGGNANTESNNKGFMKGLEEYGTSEEVLWIKEAR